MPPLLLRLDAEPPGGPAWRRALALLRNDGVLACPTETFYGLAADALSARAVGRVFEIKGREFRKPLPLLIGNAGQLPPLVRHVPPVARALMEAFWPGPLTLVFPATNLLPAAVTAGTGKVGIRLSSHPVAAALSRLLGRPLTATSANVSGGIECATADAVIRQIGPLLDGVIDGASTPGGLGSTVLDVAEDPWKVLREGAVPLACIHAALASPGRSQGKTTA